MHNIHITNNNTALSTMKHNALLAGWQAHANNEVSFRTKIMFTANSFKAHTNNLTYSQPWSTI